MGQSLIYSENLMQPDACGAQKPARSNKMISRQVRRALICADADAT